MEAVASERRDSFSTMDSMEGDTHENMETKLLEEFKSPAEAVRALEPPTPWLMYGYVLIAAAQGALFGLEISIISGAKLLFCKDFQMCDNSWLYGLIASGVSCLSWIPARGLPSLLGSFHFSHGFGCVRFVISCQQ